MNAALIRCFTSQKSASTKTAAARTGEDKDGRFTRQHLSGLDCQSAAVSVRRFGGGRGLAILRCSPAPHLAQDSDTGDWLTDLVALLHPALPQLRFDQDGETASRHAVTLSARPATPPVPAPARARPERPAAPEPEDTAPLLPRAAAALERSRTGPRERDRQPDCRLGVAPTPRGDALGQQATSSPARSGCRLWPRFQPARPAYRHRQHRDADARAKGKRHR